MTQGFDLTKLSQATAMLAECKTIEDAKHYRDLAEAARHYAKVQGLGMEAQKHAAEIKLRAERRIGEMLRDSEKNTGVKMNGRDAFGGSIVEPPKSDAPTLSALGIGKTDSHRWQSIASIPQELFEQHVAAAKELTTSGTAKLGANYRKHEERKATARTDGPIPQGVHLYHAPFQDVCAELPEGSIDFILTDPPYPGEFLPLWLDLADAAKRVLKPGGYLFAYSGQMFLPDVMNMLGNTLDYVWLAGIHHTHGYTQIWRHEILNAIKPILIYSKGEPSRSLAWLVDLFSGGQGDKEAHHWAQPEAEAAYFIEKVTYPGETVLDPFMGSGTIPRAAHKLGRTAIGCEIDEHHYMTARGTF